MDSYAGGKLYTYKEDTGCSLVHSWASARSSGFCGYAEKTGYFYTFSSASAFIGSMGKQELVGDSFVLRDSISVDNGNYKHNGVSCTKSQYNSIEKSYTDSYYSYGTFDFLNILNILSDEKTTNFNQLKTALESYRPVYAMEAADYDGNGKEEAFVVLGDKNSSSKTVQGIPPTVSHIIQVSDPSRTATGNITSEKDDTCYTTKSVFSAQYGHQYVDVPLNYDKDTQEFSYPES